ncbi:glucosyltransferase domain-containing protein [Enterobacteriaceae bacterium G50]|nr:glucosyltransferase domain-containing protein [Enterobacteriaceae bacterium G50]
MEGFLKNKLHVFFLILSCSIIYNFGALTQTYYFYDDIGRNAIGYGYYDMKGFGEYADTGRPAAEVVIRLLSGWFGRPMDVIALDVHPLTKIISILCLAFAGWVVYVAILKKETWTALLVSLIVVFSPYYISCMQYRFDSATIGLALFFSVLPFVVNHRRYYIHYFVCYLVMLCFYQSFLAVPVILIATILMRDYFDSGKINSTEQKYWLKAIIAIFAAFFCYKLLLMMLPARPYTILHGRFIPLSLYGWVVFKINFVRLINIFFSPYQGVAGIVFIFLVLLSLIGIVSNAKRKGRVFWKDGVVYLTISPLLIISAILPFSLLYMPILMARTLIGAQFSLIFCLLPICWLASGFFKSILSGFVLLYILFSALNSAITNAIRSQNNYEDRLYEKVLVSVDNDYLPRKIYFNDSGDYFSWPWLRSVKNTIQNYPFTRYILNKTYIMNDMVWAERQAQLYNAEVQVQHLSLQKEWTFNEICHWPLKTITQEFILYGKEDVRVIDMTKAPCPE